MSISEKYKVWLDRPEQISDAQLAKEFEVILEATKEKFNIVAPEISTQTYFVNDKA